MSQVAEETGHGEVRSGGGPLSVRVRPSSPKRDCAPRLTSTSGKASVHVHHATSRLTLEPLRTLRSEHKGDAAAARTGRGPSLQVPNAP